MLKMIKVFNTQSEHWGESVVFIILTVMQHNEYNLPQVLLNILAL